MSFIAPHEVAKDSLIPGCRDVLLRLKAQGFSFRFLTGRNEGLREVTSKWLVDNLGRDLIGGNPSAPPPYMATPLIMRPLGNQENASTYKERYIHDIAVYERPDVFLAFEDSPYLWDVYRKYGAVVFKAPDCWETILPVQENKPEEVPWAK